ncbi:MAG: twin-arginine translocase TatA/TatE family subunit [Bacillota bacterium]
MFGRLGWTEILLILLALVLIFGAAKLPQLARGVGESFKEFKKAVKEEEKEKQG